MDSWELPLWELFNRLQKAKFPLGIDEYKLLIEALSQLKEEEIKDTETIKRLCCALWVKSASDKLRFDTYFQQFVSGNTDKKKLDNTDEKLNKITVKQKVIAFIQSRLNWKTSLILGSSLILLGIGSFRLIQQFKERETIPPVNNTPTVPVQPPNNPNNNTQNNSPNGQTQTPIVKEEDSEDHEILLIVLILFLGTTLLWRGVRILIQSRRKKATFLSKNSQIIAILPTKLTSDYFPITQRQMKQSWRQARCLVRAGPSTELDVNATVKQISRQGFLLNPVLIPRRINRTQLLLLIDRSKSMVPFQSLCEQLAKTAQDSGRFQQTWVYYFSNYPICKNEEYYLCPDAHCLQIQPLKTLMPQLNSNYAGILIISDGGAMRGNLNTKRFDHTMKFMAQLKEHTDKLSWLNPLPPSRWQNNTAGKLSQEIPMFELSRTGLETALIAWRKR